MCFCLTYQLGFPSKGLEARAKTLFSISAWLCRPRPWHSFILSLIPFSQTRVFALSFRLCGTPSCAMSSYSAVLTSSPSHTYTWPSASGPVWSSGLNVVLLSVFYIQQPRAGATKSFATALNHDTGQQAVLVKFCFVRSLTTWICNIHLLCYTPNQHVNKSLWQNNTNASLPFISGDILIKARSHGSSSFY